MRAIRFAVVVTLALVGASAALGGDRSTGGGISGRFQIPARPVWVGEAFGLSLTWETEWRTFRNLQGALQWAPQPLIVEPWSEPTLAAVKSPGGADLARVRLETRALVLQAGSITLQPAHQGLTVETGMEHSGDYERTLTADVSAQTAPAIIQVKPLPPAPADFSGAIGHFALRSWIDAPNASVGQAIAWNLALSGIGNWPYVRGLPARLVSDDFDVLGSPAVEESADALFERRIQEKVLLVPKRAGRFELRAVQMVVFDPEQGRYLTLETPAITLEVAAAGDAPPKSAAGPVPESSLSEAKTVPDAALSWLLPAGRGHVAAPLQQDEWRRALLAPPLALAGFAAVLALARFRTRHRSPQWNRAYRGARAALENLARTYDAEERRALLRTWQKNAAVVCNLNAAAPVPAAFNHSGWARLWAESDVSLYGRSGALSGDWIERAQRLLQDRRAARRDMRRTHLAVTVCLIGASLATAAFRSGGEETNPLDGDPLDWIANARAAVANVSHERWDAAAGQAAIAWIQHPNSGVTRRLWLYTAERAQYAPETRGGAPRPLGLRRVLASVMSSSQWQRVVLLLEWAAAACMGLLWVRRRLAFDPTARAASAVLGLCVLGTAVGLSSLQAFSAAQAPSAVLIWHAAELRALPLEAPAGAPAAANLLPPGMMARVDRSFLDWRRVTLTDGRTGWLRRSDLYWLWQRSATRE